MELEARKTALFLVKKQGNYIHFIVFYNNKRIHIYRYKVERIGFNERKGNFGLAVAFEKLVQTTISELQVGPKTLLTRFGGIVGVGENVLWIFVFIFSSVGFLRDFMKKSSNIC